MIGSLELVLCLDVEGFGLIFGFGEIWLFWFGWDRKVLNFGILNMLLIDFILDFGKGERKEKIGLRFVYY